ncbi:MAG: radical SAM protein [Desulfomonilaceae bacterium]
MTRPSEKGAIRKPRGPTIPVAIVYPNVYRVGMGNLGFQFLYHYLNAHPRFSAERFFCPHPLRIQKAHERPPASEESHRTLRDFRLIAFSVPFENDYPAIPAALLAAGIPPFEKDRKASDPLIIAGGVSVSVNPEPLAPFLDLIFIGEVEDEGEENGFFPRLAEVLSSSSRGIRDRRGILDQFRGVPGVYVPSAYTFDFGDNGLIQAVRVKPGFPDRVIAVKRPSKEGPVPVSVLFSPEAEFGESLLVETNRGCGRGCRFCAAGWIHFPVRHAVFDRFRRDVDGAIEAGRTVGLIGSDLAGHPELEDILASIVDRGGKFSLSSIRPEGLSPRVIELLARTGQKTATLAPEVASPRLKKVIGKEIPADRFYELVQRLVTGGIPNLRFYFMIGLPTETDDDVGALVDFVLECKKIFLEASRPMKKIGKIGVQVNPFIPKPWTPFQWAPMALSGILQKRVKIIQAGLGKEANLVVRVESIRQAASQGVLSRGDMRVARALHQIASQNVSPQAAFKNQHIEPDFYLYRERSFDEIFPWDVTDHGVRKEALWRLFARAMSEGKGSINSHGSTR